MCLFNHFRNAHSLFVPEGHAIPGRSCYIRKVMKYLSVINLSFLCPESGYTILLVISFLWHRWPARHLNLMIWCWGQKVVYIWIVLKLIDIIFSNIPVKYIKIAHNTKTIAAFYISGTFCPWHHDIVNFGKVMLYPEGHAIPRRSCYIRKVMLYPEGDKVWSISSPSGYILQKAFFRHVPAYLK